MDRPNINHSSPFQQKVLTSVTLLISKYKLVRC